MLLELVRNPSLAKRACPVDTNSDMSAIQDDRDTSGDEDDSEESEEE